MPPATLRLLTWNLGRVHFGRRINRWLGLDSRASDGDVPHVARVIVESGADVVALQELRAAAQLERLREQLGGEWRAAAPDGPNGPNTCDRQVGLLARAGLAPDFSTVDMGATGRLAQAVSLAVDGQRWAVASLHLDAYDPVA